MENSMKRFILGAAIAALLGVAPPSRAQAVGDTETGLAAVYSNRLHGRVTASGQVYDKAKLTAAHKTLPFGTKIKVTTDATGKSIELVVNDRGPFQEGRILDISPAAAAALGMKRIDLKTVTLEIVEVGDGKRVRRR
jgi:rare lipoprotein A